MINTSAWIVVNKDGNPVGVDDTNSGGYPYIASSLNSVHFFHDQAAAEKYYNVINYGDKGYQVKSVELVIK